MALSAIQMAIGHPWIDGKHLCQYSLKGGVVKHMGEFVKEAKPRTVTTGFWIFKKEKTILAVIGSCHMDGDDFMYIDEERDWRRIKADPSRTIFPN